MSEPNTQVRQRPNIVLILMDDMGYGDPGCYGNAYMNTPNMDAIARGGITFTQMYSAPTCSPARAQLLTGKYAQKAGIPRVLFPEDTIGIEHRTVASYLKEQGYATSCIGKWHLGSREEHAPTRHGFDRFYGLLYSNDMDPLHLYRNESVEETEVDQSRLTEQYTNEAIDFFTQHRHEPFFCYLAHTMPHIPLHVPEQFRGRSRCGTYGDTIECIDYHIGRMLGKLEQLGIAESTLFIVTSDNGPWFEGSIGGLRGRKFSVYEGGVRMPFIAQWPGRIQAGSECREVAHFMDMLPTFVSVAGEPATPVPDVDGYDITELFTGGGKSPHEAIYFYDIDRLNAIRSGKWKLHVADRQGTARTAKEMPQLFDMDIDPGECYNLADRHPDVVARLTGMMREFDASIQPIRHVSRQT